MRWAELPTASVTCLIHSFSSARGEEYPALCNVREIGVFLVNEICIMGYKFIKVVKLTEKRVGMAKKEKRRK